MSARYDKWGVWRMIRFLIQPEKQVDPEYTRPEDDAQYKQELHWDGFITKEHWEDDDLEDYPMLVQDLEDLEEYLLPAFWEFNQRARHYQRRYYLYQRIFKITAFVTTIVSVVNSYIFSIAPDGLMIPLPEALGTGISVNQALSAATAVVAGFSSYYTLMTNYGEPRKNWARYRRLAEELRILYFRYLARIEPYHTETRIDEMRRAVLNIRGQERDNG